MRRTAHTLLAALAGVAAIAAGIGIAAGGEPIGRNPHRTPSGGAHGASAGSSLARAQLIIEVNDTDGDAGLQVSLDGDPWRDITIYRPDGSEILAYRTRSDVRGYGMTELFSESSEPPFTQFPLEEFQSLFPEGEYRIVGHTIDGREVANTVTLTHDIPSGPEIVAPADGATVPIVGARIRWQPAPQPAGVDIVGYEVTLEREDPLRIFTVDLPPDARGVRIPTGYLEPGIEYSAEVLAIDRSGNQTLTNITITAE